MSGGRTGSSPGARAEDPARSLLTNNSININNRYYIRYTGTRRRRQTVFNTIRYLDRRCPRPLATSVFYTSSAPGRILFVFPTEYAIDRDDVCPCTTTAVALISHTVSHDRIYPEPRARLRVKYKASHTRAHALL